MNITANSTNGGALNIQNDANQSSGELVNITGSAAKVALKVSEGKTLLDANASSADTLVVQNSQTQDSSSKLVYIIGQSNKTALKVGEGNTELAGETTVHNLTGSTGTFTTLSASSGLIITPSSSQPTSPGSPGELQIVGNIMYLYTDSGWMKTEFVPV